ncbi:MAG TPA: c-type cytochrome [Bryobacteraceae bacterium]|jgi:cytochrome c oxidase cbb3-type subunit 3|nr:c-type cytochrome [Bryobacteraceae bacterium]
MTNPKMLTRLLAAVSFTAATVSAQQPDMAASKATFDKVCGTCHTPESALSTPRTKAQWEESIDKMVQLGAKGTDDEFAAILNFLVSQYGRDAVTDAALAGRGGRGGAPARPAGGIAASAGAEDKHVVDAAAADRGRKVWAAECINCHGTYARGTDNGPSLVRADLVARDRYGNQLGPFLRKGHPMQSGSASANLTAAQISELSHFLHQRLYDTLRGSPIFIVHDVVTGDAKAGAAYFNGAGKCNTCHSPTGDLAGVGRKYEAATLQAIFLNPRPPAGRGGRGPGVGGPVAKPVTLTVTPPSGTPITGVVVIFDDFDVAIRDASGEYHAWKRTRDLKVVKNDPYAAHDELIQQYTDKNMHDILAYLVTLK